MRRGGGRRRGGGGGDAERRQCRGVLRRGRQRRQQHLTEVTVLAKSLISTFHRLLNQQILHEAGF